MLHHLTDTYASRAPRPNRPSVIFHAKDSWLASVRDGKFDFSDKIATYARSQGCDTYTVEAGSERSNNLLAQTHAHIFIGHRPETDRSILHAMPSYIWGFWYLDPDGVNWNSSLVAKDFQPTDIDTAAATYFFNGVSGHMLRHNISKFQQATVETQLPPARAVIFLQELDKYAAPVHHIDTQKMIATVAKSTDQKVYVKLHPAQSEVFRNRYTSICTRFANIEITDHSIHALTQAADIVVTQNSAAGFEALLQKKPIITCGRSDYAHATLTAQSPQDLRKALRTAPADLAGFEYAKYLYWFLAQHMLEPQNDGFETHAWARISPLLGEAPQKLHL